MLHRVRRLFDIYAAYHLPQDAPRPRVARWRLVPGFVAAGARALPAALRWARHRDPAARARVKQLLDLSGPAPVQLDADLLRRPSDPTVPEGAGVTLVMPVYNGLDLLRPALDRVARHTDIPWRIVIVDDASPDPDVLPFLRDWAERHPQAQLIEAPENLGFVGAVTLGMVAARDWADPVVLLNSDAFVPAGWAARLLSPIWEDARVGSVTPLSNDAELGSVPEPGRARDIAPDLAEAVDRHAATLNGAARVAAPAGVGFCMALSPKALAEVPEFDAVFAPGYGEEVDWCQKTAQKGFTHLYVPNLFVAHVGGQSFGSEAKQRLIARNSALISRRYPRFDAEVHGFLRRDPLVTARLALGLAQVEQTRRGPLPVYLAHSMGGGAEVDLQRRLMADLARVGAALVIRVGGVFRFTLDLHDLRPDGSAGVTSGGTASAAMIAQLLAPVTGREVIYACGVGDPDPITLPDLMLSLRGPRDGLEVLVHDYFPLSPTPSLLEAGETWKGLPDPQTASPRHATRRPDGATVPLSRWRADWGRLLYTADRVTCFSEASARLIRQAYAGAPVEVSPHALHAEVPRIPRPEGPPVIGILGSLAPHKGAGVAQRLSRALKPGDPGLVLLGEIDPAYRLYRPARMHGRYAVEDLPDLVARYGITCWFIPSVWSETFSFTTHEALATGLPVMVFDLGAQADAVRAAGDDGAVLPLSAAEDMSMILETAKRLSSPA
ncbi:N-glycosyltransferase (plasmid) [Antarctobacter heliothermus]|uniref:N-glycosyltransferase n=1 Tax=Antarctobacter heliothermus TaxID=74033 RepID=A0A222EBJ9_9RHOB|nr:glycosyltransferase [Antarctobacter heliothermus]ASP23566.1 N-glycosyltransferase [Antarctobacter heliothermus]